MLQLPAQRGNAAASIAQTLTELPFGSQTQIRVGGGRIAAFLAYAGYDRKGGAAKYAVRILNNTPFPARAAMFVEAGGTLLSAYPRAVEVAPYSMRDELVPVRLDMTGPYDRAIVQVVTEEGSFTVEAPPPPRAPVHWARWGALAAMPLVLCAVFALGRPRILDVAAPSRAVAGSVLHVPYQVSGIGSVEYDFDTRDGLQIAAGLAPGSGVLALPVPRDGWGAPYALHVRMRGAFMSDEAFRRIAAVAPHRAPAAPARHAPLIESLTVSPSPVQAGARIAVRYATAARSGDVWLVDPDGTTWAHRALSPGGAMHLQIPKALAGKQLRVVLHAQRGKADAERATAITVLPANDVAAAAAPAASTRPQAPAAASPELHVSPQVVSAGDTVTARISGTHGDVRVTLMNATGVTLAEGDVDEGGAITLNAPDVSTPTAFFVVATFTSGVAQQSVMKRLTVTPR